MRNVLRLLILTFAIAGSSFTGTAFAGKIGMGTWSQAGMKQECDYHHGVFSMGTDGSFGCKGPKGYIDCTPRGQCTGVCQACGSRMQGLSEWQALQTTLRGRAVAN